MSDTTNFYQVAPRDTTPVSLYYAEADEAGLSVTHNDDWVGASWKAAGLPGTLEGNFKTIGHLIWHKSERRWEVRACADCTATELSTLIGWGLMKVYKYGRFPRYWTRNSTFMHRTSKLTGKPLAVARVAVRIEANDERETAGISVSIPDDLSNLVGTLAAHRGEGLT